MRGRRARGGGRERGYQSEKGRDGMEMKMKMEMDGTGTGTGIGIGIVREL